MIPWRELYEWKQVLYIKMLNMKVDPRIFCIYKSHYTFKNSALTKQIFVK